MFQSFCSTHCSCPKGRRSPQRLKARQSSRRKGYVSRNMRWHARTHLVCYIREECCERRKREKKRRKELVLCACVCVCVCVCSVRACGRVCGERRMDGVRWRQHFHVIAVAHGCCLDLPFPPFHPFPSLWTDSPNTPSNFFVHSCPRNLTYLTFRPTIFVLPSVPSIQPLLVN